MPGMPGPRGGRCSEMVVYTQIQRSLFYVKPLSDDQVKKNAKADPYPFHRQKRNWNITVPPITLNEMRRKKERDVLQSLTR
jgi:hypothetical protein